MDTVKVMLPVTLSLGILLLSSRVYGLQGREGRRESLNRCKGDKEKEINRGKRITHNVYSATWSTVFRHFNHSDVYT